MTEFEVDVLKQLAGIGERLMALETKVALLPCIGNCPKNGNSTRRWLYIGLGIGAGLGGAGGMGAAILRALGG